MEKQINTKEEEEEEEKKIFFEGISKYIYIIFIIFYTIYLKTAALVATTAIPQGGHK